MRYLGLDLGSKRLGVAISDSLGIVATPYEVIIYANYNELISKLKLIIESNKVDALVLGNPINLDGSMSKRSIETLKFKTMLEESLEIKVNMQDERYSTTEAENMLIQGGVRRKKRKGVIDKIAATLILQTYLDRK